MRPDSTSICQTDLLTGLLMPYTDELFIENDVFNESVLDIEKCRFLFPFPPFSSELWTDGKFYSLVRVPILTGVGDRGPHQWHFHVEWWIPTSRAVVVFSRLII